MMKSIFIWSTASVVAGLAYSYTKKGLNAGLTYLGV
jgi:hypothetical protein